LRKFINVPIVITPQGGDVFTFLPLKYGNMLKEKKTRLKTEFTIKTADAITHSSLKMKKVLADLSYEGKSYYIPNGTWLSYFPRTVRDACREKLHIPPDSLVFISVGRNSPIKGYHMLLRALSLLKSKLKTNMNWRMIIIGKNAEDLKNDILDLKIYDNVLLKSDIPVEYNEQNIPKVPPGEIVQLLCAADIYVAPALSGGFELSCADAFAAGLPIIIGDNNGSCDFVRAHQAGVVVENGKADAFADAMYTLISDEESRLSMTENVLKAAPNLDWGSIAKQYMRIFRDVAAQRANSSSIP
jgi:glycosyltransferase involved in cell wall biosynthesis